MVSVSVIDYGLGNLRSLSRSLAAVGAAPRVTANPEEILDSEVVILPGVGAFPVAMRAIKLLGIDAALSARADAGKPIVGVCLGMQLLFESSAEFGNNPGIGILRGKIVPVVENAASQSVARLTHVGWRNLEWSPDCKLRGGTPLAKEEEYFYFVHSFGLLSEVTSGVCASVNYGNRNFVAIVREENIIGVQFHPEKSGKDGLALWKRIFQNFGHLLE